MRRDCIIEWPAFDPKANQLELKISGIPQTPDGKQVIRRFLSIERQELDQLRAGNPPDALVEKLTAQVSEWLQEPDLDLAQLLKLHEKNGPTWRLVFSLPNMSDEKLPFDLSNIPIELIRPKGLTIPFALHNRVSSIVHLLRKEPKATALSATTWPLRILIVRSSPKDLHVKVPEAAPIRESILALWPDLGPFLQVDYLSSETEANVAGPPTREKLREQLGFGYDILVYLGHGDVAETQDERMPIGQLLLETVDRYTDRFDARNLSQLLHNRPVPVVLLVGCLTAAELEPEIRTVLEKDMSNWWRGSQGVAQALISSASGVQFVVGMRYRIEADDGIRFLNTFFKSLLGAKPNERFGNTMGNLELAVREAREQLNLLGKQQTINWAAPVLFRTEEPTLHFLSSPPLYHIKPELQEYRTTIWESLAKLNWSMRSAANESDWSKRIIGVLKEVENEILNDVRNNKASLLMPRRVEINLDLVHPPIVDVVVELHDTMQVKELEGTLVEGSGVGHFLMLTPSSALEDAGFDFWLSPTHNNQIKFLIRWPESGQGTLPQGILFRAKLAIGDAIQVVYPLNLTDLKADPPRPLCPGNNAIIVPAP